MSAELHTLPKPWERTLAELRQLMRNVVANHDRIRERVLQLKDQYFDGQMGDGAKNWEKWAINHFAYSRSYLRFLSSRHPLQIERWEAQRARAEAREKKAAIIADRSLAQAAWDEWKAAERRAQEESNAKERKRLKNNEKQKRYREASKLSAVSQRRHVIDEAITKYRSLSRSEQDIFLGLIGCQRIRGRKGR